MRPGLTGEKYHALASEILNAIESRCRANRWNLVFRGIVEPDKALRGVFEGRRYIVGEEWPGTVLDIHWNSWPDYLKALKHTHRTTEKRIREQLNRGRRGEVVIEELADPSTVEADLYRILADHHYRKNKEDFFMGPNFPTILKQNLGDRAVILVARKKGRIVGVSIHLRNSTAMHLKFVGIDNDMVKSREAVYFSLAFHQLIERACAGGFKQLYLGIMTYYPKCSRGARLVPTSSWIWEPGYLGAMIQRLLSYQARRQGRGLTPYSDQEPMTGEPPKPCYKWPPQSKAMR
jgi:predicted N-acyltransferase